jgi:hypothetical protein
MNLNDPRHPWTRLTAAARQSPDDRDSSAPYGFATRIAALALAQERRVSAVFERFAFRAIAISCLLALGSVAVNYPAVRTLAASPVAAAADDETAGADDALAAILDLGD